MPAPSREPILIVDDDAQLRGVIRRLLERAGHDCAEARDVGDARRQLAARHHALVLCDVNLPAESGLDLIAEVLAGDSRTAAVMVSGMDSRDLATAALDLGAYGYIVKPFKANEMVIAVSNALRRRALEIVSRERERSLEAIVADRTAELRDAIGRLEGSVEELHRSHEETIHRLAKAVDFRNEETGGHVERMGASCGVLAARLGLPRRTCELIRIASPMHDVGKIAVPDRILMKPGRLDADERAEMGRHAGIEQAVAVMVAGRGTHFDERVLDDFLAGMDDLLGVRGRLDEHSRGRERLLAA